jgi:hypothetical protein
LSFAFRRHGIQAVALLDPNVDISPEYSESLSLLLEKALNIFDVPDIKNSARIVISEFLASVGNYSDRSKYIAQLADGTYNFFSLTVEPDIAEQFRKRLKPLTLFLDTNFLFGILDLHANIHVKVSNELLNSIDKYKLPFYLRYHERTEREMESTMLHYSEVLRAHRWTQAISRAAIRTKYISGIELKYHQINSEKGIDVDSFLQPYEHLDVLLKDKKISTFRTSDNRMSERTELLFAYQEFLKRHGIEKPYESVEHDTTVLETVRHIRSNAKSSIEAGALLLTCDFMLFRFDWETSKKAGIPACAVFPNLLWQILRPFVPTDINFERAFAETFAIPEFRSMTSSATRATTKLLGILASYDDFPEETAASILTNDLIIDKLKDIKDPNKFREYVESEIANCNEILIEEKAALEKQLKREKEESIEMEKRSTEEKAKLIEDLKKKEEELESLQENIRAAQKNEQEAKEKENKAQQQIAIEKEARERAETILQEEKTKIVEPPRSTAIYKFVTETTLSVVLIMLFELITYKIPWTWLLEHPNSYAIQGLTDLIILTSIYGLFYGYKKTYIWAPFIFEILVLVVSLFGGPKSK